MIWKIYSDIYQSNESRLTIKEGDYNGFVSSEAV